MAEGIRRSWGAAGAALVIVVAMPAVGGQGGGHGGHHHGAASYGAPAATSATNPAAPASTAAMPTVLTTPTPYNPDFSCDRPASADQDHLCLERRAAAAAEESARWAEPLFWAGVAIAVGLLSTLVASLLAGRRGRNGPS